MSLLGGDAVSGEACLIPDTFFQNGCLMLAGKTF